MPKLQTRYARLTSWTVASIASLALVGGVVLPLSVAAQTSDTQPPPLGDIPTYKGDPARTGEHPGPGPLTEPVEVWRAQIECANGRSFAPVLGDGLLIVGCDANRVMAIDAHTGIERWRADLGGPIQGSAGIADGAVYVSAAGGPFVSLDLATGTIRWTKDIHPTRHPVVVDGTLYVGTEDGRYLGLDPADGAERWSWQAPVGVSQVAGTVVGDTAYLGPDDGKLHAISIADGSERWQFQAISGQVSTPAIGTDTVYVASLQRDETPAGELYALDRATGEVVWRFRTPTGNQIAPPTLADGVVYSPSQDQGLFAFAATDGTILGTTQTGPMGGQSPAITMDAVYLATDRSLMAVGRSDAAILWSVDLGADVDTSPIVSGGLVFVTDNAGLVRAFGEPELAAVLAGSPAPSVGTPAPTAASAAATLELVETFDATASDLQQPSFIDVGPDGSLYVVNATAGEILVLDPETGAVMRRWGGPGAGEGQFNFLRDASDPYSAIGGVAVAKDGAVYVADTVNRRVQQFASDGTFIRQWGRFGSAEGQFLEPIDLDIAPNGDVHVVDDQRDDIQRFTAEGKYLGVVGGHGTDPGQLNFTSGIFVNTDGTLYIADWDNHRVQAWADDGTFLWTFGSRGTEPGDFNLPCDVAVDTAGRLYVSDSGRIQTFAADHTPTGAEPRGSCGLAISGRTLFASDTFNDQIHKFRIVE
jgi:outer membrane protein assembly factor BamB